MILAILYREDAEIIPGQKKRVKELTLERKINTIHLKKYRSSENQKLWEQVSDSNASQVSSIDIWVSRNEFVYSH